MKQVFRRMGNQTALLLGTPWAFLTAVTIVVAWAASGPLFHFSTTWQLVINTVSSLVTFLMVFLIQNTQNRDSKAIQLKLDELIRGVEGARTNLVHLENLTDDQLDDLQEEFKRLHERAIATHNSVEQIVREV